MVTIYILLWGLAFWRGLINEPLSDGVARLLRVVLIGTVALSAGIYGVTDRCLSLQHAR